MSSLSALSWIYAWNCECRENEEPSGQKRADVKPRMVWVRLLLLSQYSSLKLRGLPLDLGVLLMVHTGGLIDLRTS
jgi:hypothetical protein